MGVKERVCVFVWVCPRAPDTDENVGKRLMGRRKIVKEIFDKVLIINVLYFLIQ
jgi:hypothetical protein